MQQSMHEAQWTARLPRMSPVRAFATVFMAVFLFIFLGSGLLTYLLPETYRARARVLAPEASHLQMFHSEELLREISLQLDLPQKFAAQYGEKEPWDEDRVETLLRRSIQVRRLPGTDVIEIFVSGSSPGDCAELANAIAEAGAKLARKTSGTFRIIEAAEPPLRPSRPNLALNLALGAVVGVFLGTMAGGVGAKLAVGFTGQPTPATTEETKQN